MGCCPEPMEETPYFDGLIDVPRVGRPRNEANVRALMDCLLPRDDDSPGALEAGAMALLQLDAFTGIAQAQGLLPDLPDPLKATLLDLEPVLIDVIGEELDRQGADIDGLRAFSDLPRARQEQRVQEMFLDAQVRPVVEFARAVCFLAYLGAVENDVGLVAIGYSQFEDFDNGVAVRGYPRTRDGRLIDVDTEDLVALAATGNIDDYTFNERPLPTDDDDLSGIIDAAGYLL